MPTKPTILPKWASDDVADPSSGENNVAEPTETKKLKGWDFEEKPTRQWWNWLHRLTYQCIDWLFGTTIPLDSSVGTANEQLADGTGHTHAIVGASEAEAIAGVDNEKVMTALRTKQAVTPPVVSGFVGGLFEYVTTMDTRAASIFDVAALPAVTTHSIGPTGSGADYIWTALDSIPLTATFIKIKIETNARNNAGDFVQVVVQARDYAPISGSELAVSVALNRAVGATDVQAYALGIEEIFLDGGNLFGLKYTPTSTTSVTSQMRLVGYGV